MDDFSIHLVVPVCHFVITRITNEQVKRGREGGGGEMVLVIFFLITWGKREHLERKKCANMSNSR